MTYLSPFHPSVFPAQFLKSSPLTPILARTSNVRAMVLLTCFEQYLWTPAESVICVCVGTWSSLSMVWEGGSRTLTLTFPQVHAAIVLQRRRVMSSQARAYLSLTWVLWFDRTLEQLPVQGLAFLRPGSHRARFKGLIESSGEAAVSWTRLTKWHCDCLVKCVRITSHFCHADQNSSLCNGYDEWLINGDTKQKH